MRVPGRPAAFEGGRGVHRHDRRDHRGDPRAGRLAPAAARRRFLGAPVRYRTPALLTPGPAGCGWRTRSEEHTSELQSLMSISYAVFCLKKKQHIIRDIPPMSQDTT